MAVLSVIRTKMLAGHLIFNQLSFQFKEMPNFVLFCSVHWGGIKKLAKILQNYQKQNNYSNVATLVHLLRKVVEGSERSSVKVADKCKIKHK